MSADALVAALDVAAGAMRLRRVAATSPGLMLALAEWIEWESLQ